MCGNIKIFLCEDNDIFFALIVPPHCYCIGTNTDFFLSDNIVDQTKSRASDVITGYKNRYTKRT